MRPTNAITPFRKVFRMNAPSSSAHDSVETTIKANRCCAEQDPTMSYYARLLLSM